MTADVVQIAAPSWQRFGPRLVAEFPDFEWIVVDTDSVMLHTAAGTQAEIEPQQAQPTVAWMCFEVFGSPVMRRHFKMAETAPTVELVHASYAGLDGEYWQRLADRGIEVTSAHLSGVPIAEFIMHRVLDWFQRGPVRHHSQAAHQWHRYEYREVFGTNWLVVGMGAIGTEVAVRARAFGASVTGVRRSPAGDEPVDAMIGPDDLPDHVGKADVVVFTLPSSPDTDDLVDADLLARFKPDAVLVNVGRGSLIDEDALRQALDAEQLEGAILDVMRTEPLPSDHWMWDHPKVWVSPHNSAAGNNRFERSYGHFVKAMRARSAGRR
ncbi:MAG: NAD(P)-dependent oxidoreductase [Acidimicrobiales bacterium]